LTPPLNKITRARSLKTTAIFRPFFGHPPPFNFYIMAIPLDTVMTTTQDRPENSIGTESVELIEVSILPSTPVDFRGMVTTPRLGLVDQNRPTDAKMGPDSRIGGPSVPGVQQVAAAPRRPQLKLMTPDGPVRYLPIHVWPEHLKKVQPRTGRKYCPKRSRTMPKRNGPSPLVREYRYSEDEGDLKCEGQGLSDTETIRSCDAGSAGNPATLTTAKRRGWGHALLGAVQNAVPKRSREDKEQHINIRRKSLSLAPFRLGHPPGLRRQWSRESARQ